MRPLRGFRALSIVVPVLAALAALPVTAHAANWAVPLPASAPGAPITVANTDIGEVAAVPCDTVNGLAYYARAYEGASADEPAAQPAGTIPPGRIVVARYPGSNYLDIELYFDGPRYSVASGQLCRATWKASAAARASATRPIPQLQVIGKVSSATRTVLRRISQAPASARTAFDAVGALGVLQNVAPLPSIQGWEYLEGNCSLASESTPRTCASLPGLGGGGFGTGFIAMPARDSYSSYGGVAFHEFGHSVDQAVGQVRGIGRMSATDAFKNGPFVEVKRCWTQPYERTNIGEWFAESFAIRYTSPSKSLWLKKHCPVTWKYHTAAFGNGTFDSTIPTPMTLRNELRTVRMIPKVATGLRRVIAVRTTLSARPAAGTRMSATASYGGRVVGAKLWRTSTASSGAKLVARGVPAGRMVRVCVKAGSVGRGVAAIPTWCAFARVR
ncbi:MAG: hypothetical protein JWM90_2740 [Thermoleophilia bacterium]|nr:hypothetical protein [Thermoleophilia bacterium]